MDDATANEARARVRRPLRVRPVQVIFAVGLLLVAGSVTLGSRWWRASRTSSLLAACRDAVAHRDWSQLDKLASRWVDWDPSSSDAQVFLAEASVQLGRTEQAADALGRVQDTYHGALQALAVRGEIQFADLNRPHEAVATWRRMLEIDPRADLAHQRLIYYYSMTLRRSEMLAQILESMEWHCEPPEAYAYYLLAFDLNFSDGLSVVTRWRENMPDDPDLEVARALYIAKYTPDQGQAMFGASTVAAGDLTLINECLAKYPSHLEVLAFHLDHAIYDGDAHRVLRLLEVSPETAKGDPRFWRARGWYLAEQGMHAEAEQALRQALKLHPPSWRTWLILAGVLRRLQHAQAAQAAQIAMDGKQLERDLFELPTARALDDQLGSRIHAYLSSTGPASVALALERRLK